MLDLLRDRAYEETKKRNEDKDEARLLDIAERIAITCFGAAARLFRIRIAIGGRLAARPGKLQGEVV